MKCQKHDCEMSKEIKPGWGSQKEWVCPQCAEEKVRLAIRGQGVKPEEKGKTSRRGGWQ